MIDQEKIEEMFPYEASGVRLSELKVMRSAAGWYIGRQEWDEDQEMGIVSTRESGYYRSKFEAESALETGNWYVRQCEENEWLYAQNEDLRPKVNFS